MDLEALYDPDKDPSKNPQPKPPEPEKLTLKELVASWVSRGVLGFILFLSFLVGGWVAGVGLHDPDTCWLLALGRIICDSGIPATDPFSWTFTSPEGYGAGRHFVLYQWLSEAVFHLATIPGGLLTLLMFAATVVVTAFISLPLGIVVRRNPPFLAGLLVVVLGIVAVAFHTLVRPEIFSFMFLALFLQVLHYARMTVLAGSEKLFRFALVLAPLMVLWCNMHTGFTGGLVVVAATVAGSLIGVALGSPRKDLLVQSLVSLGACALASLINPYGIGLWVYIPDLFGLPINQYIQELKPITLTTLADPKSWSFTLPFAVLSLLFVVLWVSSLAAPKQNKDAAVETVDKWLQVRRAELAIALAMGTVALYCGFSHRRLITFSALILVCEICALLGLRRLDGHKFDCDPAVLSVTGLKPEVEHKGDPPEDKIPFWRYLDLHSLDLWKSGGAFELAIVSFFAIAGVSLVAHRIAKPELPASSVVFKNPVNAVKFITDTPALGTRLFNDAQFGDVLIYRLNDKVKVFLDTRFDMYGPKLAGDYYVMRNCLDGWRKLVSDYKIDWVFVPLDAAIGKELLKDPAWEQVYRDDAALILKRK